LQPHEDFHHKRPFSGLFLLIHPAAEVPSEAGQLINEPRLKPWDGEHQQRAELEEYAGDQPDSVVAAESNVQG
jgi:hypothetical protein